MQDEIYKVTTEQTETKPLTSNLSRENGKGKAVSPKEGKKGEKNGRKRKYKIK